MRLLKPVMVALPLAALGAAAAVGWAGYTFGQFEEVRAAGDVACTPVVGIAGAGDIEPLPETSSAYLAAFDRRGEGGEPATRGQIVLFDTENPLDSGSWRDRTGGVPAAFVPSGLDLYRTQLPDGRTLTRLFVVNLAGPEVVVFDADERGELTVAERVSDPRLTSPNDVVATGPRSFYVTNDTASGRSTLRGKLDFLLGLRTGSILDYDGNSWAEVQTGLAFPNGLALSEDGETLFLAEMRSRTLLRYDRDPATDTLRPAGSTELPSFPNNLSVTAGGEVLVGALPQPLATSAYGEGLRERAASEVLRVAPGGVVSTLLRDSGDTLSAATMATEVAGRILVGSRAADRFLMCRSGDGRTAGGAGSPAGGGVFVPNLDGFDATVAEEQGAEGASEDQ